MRRNIFFLVVSCLACTQQKETIVPPVQQIKGEVFHRLPESATGLSFVNKVTEREDLDVFRYRNFYNGGGVGIADFNNDGLADVYLTSNMGDNKLFINKGGWKFEDITTKAGVAGTRIWSTGVSIADVNGDGFLDIYVSNAGDVKGGNRENELFINNGDLTFTDRAREYGLADRGYSTHAAFFDYDKDGDLDCYILNNSSRPVSSLGYKNLRHVRDEFGGHKLYRNDDGFFNDVSEETGIFGSIIGFGLGVTVGDVNQDSWPDLYISNDFYERDYLYINNQKGGFDESLEEYISHISMFSMGADMADLNNDGYPEIFSTDMLPEQDYRLKTLIAFETYDVYQIRLQNGYYHQFMRNMLHLNNKDGSFCEVGELAGVSATDWSWGAVIADFDNDQYKEIFVCNGIYKDVIDQDFVEYLGNNEQLKAAMQGKSVNYAELSKNMPSHKLSNYLFTRTSELQYKNQSETWGLGEPSFSNGSAYGDLDNDGDLDLIVNNVNQEIFVYQNQTSGKPNKNFLTLNLIGSGKNKFAVGSNVKAYVEDQVLAFEHMPIRGFQSSMDYRIVIGLGSANLIDSLVVTWPDMSFTKLLNVQSNQTLTLEQKHVSRRPKNQTVIPSAVLTPVHADSIVHRENDFNDFNHYRLQYHMLSTQGPAFATADLNDDGNEDIFIGGSVGEPSRMFLQDKKMRFGELEKSKFVDDRDSEDVSAVFFDADNDRDMDLYVVTGGSETSLQSRSSLDRYYQNVGTKKSPIFKRLPDHLPAQYSSGSCVKPADFDKDGDLDLFVGTRVNPNYYGLPCDQYLLVNDGTGKFTDGTSAFSPEFRKLGMVTDAWWFDYDSNGFDDLLVIGEWMPITLFLNDGKKLKKAENVPGLVNTDGWWNRIHAADLDGDGDQDFVLGNLGLNSRFKTTPNAPIMLYVNDFDQNGSMEPIFTFQQQHRAYPYALRQDIIKQMSTLKKQFVYFKDYGGKSIDQIFDQKLLENAVQLRFMEQRSSVLINNGFSGFTLRPLPVAAQVAPVFAIETLDIDNDNDLDLVTGGNLYAVKPEIGRYDASRGLLLKNDGKGNFSALEASESGLKIDGEIRHITQFTKRDKPMLVFVRNNNSVLFYQLAK